MTNENILFVIYNSKTAERFAPLQFDDTQELINLTASK